MPPGLIVWDFDGVLNANERDGRFVWADDMKADLGVDPAVFSGDLFGKGVLREIMRGRVDLLEHMSRWLADRGHAVTGRAFLDYWFEKDCHPDPQVIGWLRATPARHVIGTNNEAHRAAYIEDGMGFGALVEKVFASGRMGVAKPDPGFFGQIERWSGAAPGRILLIDDAQANIAAARQRGWQAFHFTRDTRAALPTRLGLET